MAGISDKLKVGTFWVAGGRVFSNAMGLVSTLVLARILSPDDFGVAAIGTTLLGVLYSFTQITLGEALIHHDDPQNHHLDTVWTMAVIRAAILAAILLILTPFIKKFYGDERLVQVMLVVAASAFMTGLFNPRLAVLKRDLQFSQDLWFIASQRLALVGVSVGLALYYRSYIAIIGGIFAQAIVGVAMSYLLAPYRPSFRLKEARELFAFAGWLTLSEMVIALSWRLDPLVVGKFLGQAKLGLFSVASNLASLPTNETTGVLKTTLFPGFRKVVDDPDRLRAAYRRIQTLTTAIVVPCAFGLAAVAEPLIGLVMGQKWLAAIPIVQVLSVTYALKTLGTTAEPLAMATGMTRLLFRRNLQALILRMPVLIAGIWLLGMPGLLGALVFSTFVGIVLDMVIVRQICAISLVRQVSDNARSLVSGTVMLAGTTAALHFFAAGSDFWSSLARLAAGIVTGAILHLSTVLILWRLARYPEGPEREVLSMAGWSSRRSSGTIA